MSYLRYGQDGGYGIEIPDGSKYYIYDNGHDISGWSYGEFAAMIGNVAYEAPVEPIKAGYIRKSFEAHFGGWDERYESTIARPERAYIFCHCASERIDSIEFTDELQQAVQDWVDSGDYLQDCIYCGESVRSSVEEPVCDKYECDLKRGADIYDVDVSVIKNDERIFYELYENYGFDQGTASDLATEYLFTKSPEHEPIGVE